MTFELNHAYLGNLGTASWFIWATLQCLGLLQLHLYNERIISWFACLTWLWVHHGRMVRFAPTRPIFDDGSNERQFDPTRALYGTTTWYCDVIHVVVRNHVTSLVRGLNEPSVGCPPYQKHSIYLSIIGLHDDGFSNLSPALTWNKSSMDTKSAICKSGIYVCIKIRAFLYL